jgi:hypothetical protein
VYDIKSIDVLSRSDRFLSYITQPLQYCRGCVM